MLIANTGVEARHPWPANVFIQGGAHGAVFRPDGPPYRTAFVEVCPDRWCGWPGTFIRGEGPTLGDAEDMAWARYERWLFCDGTGDRGPMGLGCPHGPWEPRKYTNGAGYCVRCGVWATGVLPVQPDPPDREPTLLERAFGLVDDPDDEAGEEALTEILAGVAGAYAGVLPDKAEADALAAESRAAAAREAGERGT